MKLGSGVPEVSILPSVPRTGCKGYAGLTEQARLGWGMARPVQIHVQCRGRDRVAADTCRGGQYPEMAQRLKSRFSSVIQIYGECLMFKNIVADTLS